MTTRLPIADFRDQIIDAVRENDVVIITAESYRFILGACTPKIEGHVACFFILIWREVFPLRCLKG